LIPIWYPFDTHLIPIWSIYYLLLNQCPNNIMESFVHQPQYLRRKLDTFRAFPWRLFAVNHLEIGAPLFSSETERFYQSSCNWFDILLILSCYHRKKKI
jgi:hypothetical protein